MAKAIILTILLAGLIVIGTSAPAFGAQLDTRINPNNLESPFKMSYLKTIFIEYPNGGVLFDQLSKLNGLYLELLTLQTLESKN